MAEDAETWALMALAWVLTDTRRAERLLAISGLTPDQLRRGAGDPAVLAGVLSFLAGHEPDLLAAAEAIGVSAEQLARAGAQLENGA